MRTNSALLTTHSRLYKSNSHSNISHVHILCPYKYCSCFCTICTSYSICSCICHSKNQKQKFTSLSLSKDDYNSERTILSTLSTNIFQKTKRFIQGNCESSLSHSNDVKNNGNSSQENLSKKIFYDKLYRNTGNYNGRSLSEINIKKNYETNNKRPYNYWKDKYINKTYMTNFNSNLYNYNYDNKKILSYRNPLTERDNISYKKYLNKKNDENELKDNITEKQNEKIVRYFNLNYDKDVETNRIEKGSDDNSDISNNKYLNNYFRKRCKNKSTLNSPQRAKIKEILIQTNVNKNQYTTHGPNKNLLNNDKTELTNDKNRKTDINDENRDTINKINQAYEKTKLIYNNYIARKDKINYEKHINRNRNKLNIFTKKKNKTSYVKLNHNINNIKKNLSNISKIKKGNSLRESKNDNLKTYSFSFSLINNKINNSIIEKLKKELYQKNQEILEYKNKLIAQEKDVEFYKSEINRLKLLNNKYIDNMSHEEKKSIYKHVYLDEMNSNFYKNYRNIKKENNLHLNEKQLGLSSKLKINTNLNIDKDNYYITFAENKSASDKCIFAISSLTKSKSILCFDYTNKSFSFKDYADFGDFQENYSKSFENTKDHKNSSSIYLTIGYNFYIVTGENCDMFYVFNALKRTINKLCSLKNNHSNGSLINYKGDILCIGGNYNKKVELYNEAKNTWIDLPELQVERSGFASVIFKNKYIFSLFGYNLPTKQYLNSIEYLDIEKYKESSWKYLKYKNENLLSLYLNFSFCINYKDEKLIIVGGNNGQEKKPNEYFYQLIISKNFEKNKNSYIEKTNRKLKDINKNKCYLFNKGHSIISHKNNLFYMAFDDNLRLHLFNDSNMGHDVFYSD